MQGFQGGSRLETDNQIDETADLSTDPKTLETITRPAMSGAYIDRLDSRQNKGKLLGQSGVISVMATCASTINDQRSMHRNFLCIFRLF
jgi:hypothetical protein